MSKIFLDVIHYFLPDLFKKNYTNIIQMDYIFYGCYSLILIPNISVWDTSKIYQMKNIFGNCINCVKISPKFNKYEFIGMVICIFDFLI